MNEPVFSNKLGMFQISHQDQNEQGPEADQSRWPVFVCGCILDQKYEFLNGRVRVDFMLPLVEPHHGHKLFTMIRWNE